MYHLTNNANFKLRKIRPANNSTLGGKWEPGIFLSRSVEAWVNGYGYWRPWVVEFDTTALEPGDLVFESGYAGEVLVKANAFGRLKLLRVVPLDAHCREVFGERGWTEDTSGTDFQTGDKLPDRQRPGEMRGYRYPGDARNEPPEWRKAYRKRVSNHARLKATQESIDSLFEAPQGLKLLVQITYESGDSGVYPALVSRETRPDCRRRGEWRLTLFDDHETEDGVLDGVVHINFNLKNLTLKDVYAVPNIRKSLAKAFGIMAGRAEDPVSSVKFSDGNPGTGYKPELYFEAAGKIDDCWMDPSGDMHPVEHTTHDEWARDYLLGKKGWSIDQGGGEKALYELGWIRLVLERGWLSGGPMTYQLYVSHGEKSPNRAQIAELERIGIEREFEVTIDGPGSSGYVLYKPPVVMAESWVDQIFEDWDPDELGAFWMTPGGELIPTEGQPQVPSQFTTL